MDDIYENTGDYNPGKVYKIQIVFDGIIAVMLKPIITELFRKGWKLNTFLLFITQFYLAKPKDVILNTAHFLL